uniref:nitrilase-related carbon-nitrogen hydrolase n=1 Tax=Gracilinema caldarium TaxID=215591 RepID=UPI0026E94C02
MRIAIAQIDSVIGDFDGNIKKVLSFTLQAKERGADLVLFPELALCGYPPMDLLDQDSFTEGSIRALRLLQRQIPEGIAVGAGYVSRNRSGKGKLLSNNYGIIQNGQVLFEQEKTLLPTYDVFDEARYFESAEKRRIFEFQGKRLGIAICEDMWKESTTATHYSVDPVRELLDRGANVLIVPSASPYYAHKLEQRLLLAEKISRRGAVPIVYINAVGANDSIIFDGRSFVLEPGDKTPQLTLMAEGFKEDLVIWDTEGVHQSDKQVKLGPVDAAEELDTIEKALVLGIRGYMQKCGFKRAHVGLSGGIDSALVAYLAVQAIGPEQVLCFGLPSRFSSQGSKDDARE